MAGPIRGISTICVTNGTISLSGECPVCHPACHLARMASCRCSGGAVFSELSKLLNQEDALGAPCYIVILCSPQAPARGARMLRTGVIRRF
jgi:hypothetical protein